MRNSIKTENKYKRLFKDTGWFAIGGFTSKLLLFLLTPLYTVLLATNEYGVADLLNTTINLVFPVLTLAITDATLRFAMKKTADKRKVLNNSLVIVFFSFCLLLCLRPVFSLFADLRPLQKQWLFFITIYILFALHDCLSNYIKAIGKTMFYAIQGIIQTLVMVFCNLVFLLWLRMGLQGYLLSIVISHLPSIIIIIISSNLYKDITSSGFDAGLLKKMLVYCIPLIPATVAWFVNTSIDKYMIINMYGIEESGIYGIAHKIPTIITTLGAFFVSAWTLSSIQNHGSKDESEYTTKVYNALNILLVIGCLVVISFDKLISKLLFAGDYYVAWKYVPFLMISAVFSSLSGFLAGPYRAEKKTISLLMSVLIGAALNICLNVFLLKYMGVIGAAMATSISFFVVWLIRMIVIQRIVIVKPRIVSSTISYLLMFFAAIFMTFDINYSLYFCLALLGVIVLINYKGIIELVKIKKLFVFRQKKQANQSIEDETV